MKRGFWSSTAVRIAMLVSALWCAYAGFVWIMAPEVVQTVPIFDATLALVLGLLLTMRTNQSYGRWWEGRILWGTLVNASRNLAVKAAVYAEPDAAEAARLQHLLAAFAYGLRDHLREGAQLADLPGEEEGDPAHVPSFLVGRMQTMFRDWSRAERISPDELRMLDLEARILLDVCGGCERIRNTPLPPSLTWITRLAVALALFLAPWFIGEELGWAIIPIAGVGAFLLLVAETIANSMEHPFGRELNQLDLTLISEAIDVSTREILGVESAS